MDYGEKVGMQILLNYKEEIGMIQKVELEMERRLETKRLDYVSIIGSIIKQARIMRGLTQEALARGLCSNTYISKLENWQIIPHSEMLYIIAERVDIPASSFEVPQNMLDYLMKCLEYYMVGDCAGYRDLLETMGMYDFGVGMDVMRFGYALIQDDAEQAKKYFDNGFSYFKNMDDFGFSLFMMFAIEYLHKIRNYTFASDLLDKVDRFDRFFMSCHEMYHFQRYVNYGKLHQFSLAKLHFDAALALFRLKNNGVRIRLLEYYQAVFRLAESGEVSIKAGPADHPMITKMDREEEVILRAHLKDRVTSEEFSCIGDESVLAGEKRYLMLTLNLPSNFPREERIAELAAFQSKHPDQPNYLRFLEAEANNDLALQKDLISETFYPFAKRIQSVLLLRYWLTRLSGICFEIKRYKESAYYYTLIADEIRSLTTKHKTDPYGPAMFKPTLK
jgi:transcriptional regulator with XRE-family HTH domain